MFSSSASARRRARASSTPTLSTKWTSAAWRLPGEPPAQQPLITQQLELFHLSGGADEPLLDLRISASLPQGDAAFDPECLESGAACEDDGECCGGSCVDALCAPARILSDSASQDQQEERPQDEPASEPEEDPGDSTEDFVGDPDCLEAGTACEEDGECCSGSCDEVCVSS